MMASVANPGCALQIQAELRRVGVTETVVHPVELLDAACRCETEPLGPVG